MRGSQPPTDAPQAGGAKWTGWNFNHVAAFAIGVIAIALLAAIPYQVAEPERLFGRALSALDPTLSTGLPAPMTAATGMDALTHAVESFISKTSTEQTEGYAEIAVRLIFQHLPTAYAEGENVAARKGMALASYYAEGVPYGRAVDGTVASIEEMSRASMIGYVDANYRPEEGGLEWKWISVKGKRTWT